jgi:hypothetical protein
MRTGPTSAPPAGGYSPAAPFVQPPAPRGRRQPALIALGVCLIGISATGFVFWSQQSAAKSSVLVLTKDVAYGDKITPDDVRAVDISLADGVRAISAASLPVVTQEVATTQLHAGSILTVADIGLTPPIPPGTDLVGITLKADDTPIGLAPGRTVMLIADKVWKVSAAAASDPAAAKAPPDWIMPTDPPTWKATIVSVQTNKITVAVQQADAVIVQEYAHQGGVLGVTLLPAGS